MRFKDKIQSNIDPEYFERLAFIESSGNPNAQARTSSAAGLFQFTEGTWNEQVQRLGLDYTPEDRFDPKKSRKVVEGFTKQNQRYLKQALDRDVTSSELYLSHFLGMGGARKLLTTLDNNPNASVSEVLGEASIKANRSIFLDKSGKPKTVKDIYNWANKKFGIEEEYDYYNDPKNLYVETNKIEYKESLAYAPPQEPDYNIPAQPQVNIPYIQPEEATEQSSIVESAMNIIENKKNEQAFLQDLMKANSVQYIDPNENS